MDNLYIIKIGGNIIDDEEKLSLFLRELASIKEKKILVHGGGKLATRVAEALGIPQQMVEGRRITDAETLKVVAMVYAGFINKNIVGQLQSHACNALGLTGVDGASILAHKRISSSDYGFVGDIDKVNTSLFQSLIDVQNLVPVVAPITADKNGQLLNTNADTIAQEIAKSLSRHYQTHLIFSFEKEGVLLNADDDSTAIPQLSLSYYKELKSSGAIFAGMIPKLDNAFAALGAGVHRVCIGKAEKLQQLISKESGTSIVHE